MLALNPVMIRLAIWPNSKVYKPIVRSLRIYHERGFLLNHWLSIWLAEATAGMTLVHSGLMQSDGPKRVSPCMLAFTSKANVMAVIRGVSGDALASIFAQSDAVAHPNVDSCLARSVVDHHCTQSFEWNQAVVELVLDAATTMSDVFLYSLRIHAVLIQSYACSQ